MKGRIFMFKKRVKSLIQCESRSVKPVKIKDDLYACKKDGQEFSGGMVDCLVKYYDESFGYPYTLIINGARKDCRTLYFHEVLKVAYTNRDIFSVENFKYKYSSQELTLLECILRGIMIVNIEKEDF